MSSGVETTSTLSHMKSGGARAVWARRAGVTGLACLCVMQIGLLTRCSRKGERPKATTQMFASFLKREGDRYRWWVALGRGFAGSTSFGRGRKSSDWFLELPGRKSRPW